MFSPASNQDTITLNVTYQTGFSCRRLIAESAENNKQNGGDAGSVEITPSIFAVGLYPVCLVIGVGSNTTVTFRLVKLTLCFPAVPAINFGSSVRALIETRIKVLAFI